MNKLFNKNGKTNKLFAKNTMSNRLFGKVVYNNQGGVIGNNAQNDKPKYNNLEKSHR